MTARGAIQIKIMERNGWRVKMKIDGLHQFYFATLREDETQSVEGLSLESLFENWLDHPATLAGLLDVEVIQMKGV